MQYLIENEAEYLKYPFPSSSIPQGGIAIIVTSNKWTDSAGKGKVTLKASIQSNKRRHKLENHIRWIKRNVINCYKMTLPIFNLWMTSKCVPTKVETKLNKISTKGEFLGWENHSNRILRYFSPRTISFFYKKSDLSLKREVIVSPMFNPTHKPTWTRVKELWKYEGLKQKMHGSRKMIPTDNLHWLIVSLSFCFNQIWFPTSASFDLN